MSTLNSRGENIFNTRADQNLLLTLTPKRSIQKLCSFWIISIVMLFGMASPAGAFDHVITIYFAGTGTPTNAWDGDNSAWDTRSLIPVLYNHDAGHPWNQLFFAVTQHKIHVAGVGAPPDCSALESIYQKADPHDLLDRGVPADNACRTWQATVNEALVNLSHILTNKLITPQDQVTLNLVGHSRGAVSVLWFLHAFSALEPVYDMISRINAIILDPVPGIDTTVGYLDFRDVQDGPMGWDVFHVNDYVDKLVAIYALDERSAYMEPVVPKVNCDSTETYMFAVRGGHQTMVGNQQIGGHDTGELIARPYKGYWTVNNGKYDSDLLVIYDLVGITVTRLLHGLEWGGVRFNDLGDNQKASPYRLLTTALCKSVNGLDGENCKPTFVANVQKMNYEPFFKDPYSPGIEIGTTYWDRMRGIGFVPGDDLSGYTDACRWKKGRDAENTDRCLVIWDGRIIFDGLENQDGSEYRASIPLIGVDNTPEETWEAIYRLAEGDDDPGSIFKNSFETTCTQ